MFTRDPIKVYDARWEAHEFTDDQVRRLFEATFAYGRRLGVDTVTLARDGRLAAAHVLELGMEAALRMGLRVYLNPNPIGTPHSYFNTLFVTHQHPATMGLTITASHNPAQYIGVKFVVPVVQAIGYDCGPDGGLAAIRRLYRSGEEFDARPGGRLHLIDLEREYIEFSMENAGVTRNSLDGLSVVLDGFHGSAGPEVYAALDLAGVSVEHMRLLPDGHFPSGSPNPTSQGKMGAAVELARRRGCDAVIGLDGDGDRVVFGDARGVLSAGFVAIPLISSYGLQMAGEPVPVLYDPKVNPLALAEWGKLGARPVLFRNGHSQIKDYMRRIGAIAAAEESGHYYHRVTLRGLTACCENSVLTILLLLSALKARPGMMDELWTMQNSIATTGEFNYQFDSDATRDAALGEVIEHWRRQGASSVTATPEGINLEGTVLSSGVIEDGKGLRLEKDWYSGYLRVATNEKAVVRSYFSAANGKILAEIESQTRAMLGNAFAGRVID